MLLLAYPTCRPEEARLALMSGAQRVLVNAAEAPGRLEELRRAVEEGAAQAEDAMRALTREALLAVGLEGSSDLGAIQVAGELLAEVEHPDHYAEAARFAHGVVTPVGLPNLPLENTLTQRNSARLIWRVKEDIQGLEDQLDNSPVEEVWFDLSALAGAWGLNRPWAALTDPRLETMAGQARKAGRPFGVAGLPALEDPFGPGVLAEITRLGAASAVLWGFPPPLQGDDRRGLEYSLDRLRTREGWLRARPPVLTARHRSEFVARLTQP
ncbi:MAG: hypothetical protein OEV94_02660 [Deltaproteobacteria bacterium]|nr:hypothetical protein [Deltaproteobacteria bacterium]